MSCRSRRQRVGHLTPCLSLTLLHLRLLLSEKWKPRTRLSGSGSHSTHIYRRKGTESVTFRFVDKASQRVGKCFSHVTYSYKRPQSLLPETSQKPLRKEAAGHTFLSSSWMLVSQFLSSCEICLKQKKADSSSGERLAGRSAECPLGGAWWGGTCLVVGGELGEWVGKDACSVFLKKNNT